MLDKAGMVASVTCAVHCMIMPLIITLLPIFGLSLFATEEFEWILLMISAMLGVTSLCFGFRKHKSFKAFSFLGIGLTMIVIGRLMHEHINHLKVFHFDLYLLFLVIGAIMVALSHWLNNRLCNTCQPCHHSGCSH
jgi:predicted membrane channel-forming protein YqfA (hemolysin III family)